MTRVKLHLVKSDSFADAELRAAVEKAFHWVVRQFPRVDPAMIAGWAEEVFESMRGRGPEVKRPNSYAQAALKGKVTDWLKTLAAQEKNAGIGPNLERLGGSDTSFQENLERNILFSQLAESLEERDRYILVLLRNDRSTAEIASLIHVSEPAARKAIQRLKEKLAALLRHPPERKTKHGSIHLCDVKG